MENNFSVKDLDYFLLDTKNPPIEHIDKVESAFKFWKNTWESAFKEINVDYGQRLNSDPFLEREASALFYNDNPVALFFNSFYQIRESQLYHSYFNNYPESVLDTLKSMNVSGAMALSFMTIHPEWRKEHTDVPLADVLFSLGVKRFQTTSLPILVGYIRKDMGSFHRVFERHGGRILTHSTAYNVDVDFMYMDRQSMRLSPLPGVEQTVEFLWSKRNESHTPLRRVSV